MLSTYCADVVFETRNRLIVLLTLPVSLPCALAAYHQEGCSSEAEKRPLRAHHLVCGCMQPKMLSDTHHCTPHSFGCIAFKERTRAYCEKQHNQEARLILRCILSSIVRVYSCGEENRLALFTIWNGKMQEAEEFCLAAGQAAAKQGRHKDGPDTRTCPGLAGEQAGGLFITHLIAPYKTMRTLFCISRATG